ncbi:hypothetical protein [Flavobacterium sp.]|uniref:hypothetical protein n=1 Tax=Flavobacterium sp. TaxID=239 RepID=UPI00262F9E36|nr:hypothetical protein [Flavobacterium sp.]MDG2430889.1 hypothetical protein [Flavobacterium sp.]
MKKHEHLKILFILIILSFFSSCSNEQQKNEAENILISTTSKSLINESLIKLGARKIVAENYNSKTIYHFETFRNFNLFGKSIDLSSYKFIKKNNMIFLNNNQNYKLKMINNQPYIYTPNYKGFVKDNNTVFLDSDAVILMLFVINDNSNEQEKIDTKLILDNVSKIQGGCSVWNTYYSAGIGANKAASLSNLEYNANDAIHSGDLNGCKLLSLQAETSCAWESSLCVSTIAWCCS